MAKKSKFPRKLRVKLEKIASERDARAGRKALSEMTPEELKNMSYEEMFERATETLYREFIPKGSVALMHARLDEQRHQLVVLHHLEIPHVVHERVVVPPPWEDHPVYTPSSIPT